MNLKSLLNSLERVEAAHTTPKPAREGIAMHSTELQNRMRLMTNDDWLKMADSYPELYASLAAHFRACQRGWAERDRKQAIDDMLG